jgi:hypothetical protein
LGCLVCQYSTWHSFLPWHTPVGPIGCPSPVDSCRQSHAMAPQGCPLHGSSKFGRCARNVPRQYGRCARNVPSPAIWPLCPNPNPNPNPPSRGQGLGANGVETRFELPPGLQVSIASQAWFTQQSYWLSRGQQCMYVCQVSCSWLMLGFSSGVPTIEGMPLRGAFNLMEELGMDG